MSPPLATVRAPSSTAPLSMAAFRAPVQILCWPFAELLAPTVPLQMAAVRAPSPNSAPVDGGFQSSSGHSMQATYRASSSYSAPSDGYCQSSKLEQRPCWAPFLPPVPVLDLARQNVIRVCNAAGTQRLRNAPAVLSPSAPGSPSSRVPFATQARQTTTSRTFDFRTTELRAAAYNSRFQEARGPIGAPCGVLFAGP